MSICVYVYVCYVYMYVILSEVFYEILCIHVMFTCMYVCVCMHATIPLEFDANFSCEVIPEVSPPLQSSNISNNLICKCVRVSELSCTIS